MLIKAKNIFIAIFFIGFVLRATAQKDTAVFKNQQLYISAGVGLSDIKDNISGFRGGNRTFFGNIVDQQLVPYYNHFYYTSPVYNLNVDFRVSEKSSIGFAISYQYLKNIPIALVIIDSINYPIENINYQGPNETVSRLNVAWRYLHLIAGIKNKHIKPYWGVRFGLSYWKDILPNTTQYNALIAQYRIGYYPQLRSSTSIAPSLQLLGGLRFFATSHIALHLEIGLGTPYLAEGGVTYVIDGKKELKK